ncbi:MAG: amidohydrolase, partial [Candidatus Sumerlaeia bacterium]|nr:amidohydrolase [Candidatus Sumerlaeia bacterium]
MFHELIGFRDTTGDLVARTRGAREAASRVNERVRVSLAPHAPYSVSPELFQAIRAEVDRSEIPYTSVHVGESAEEMELL